CRPDKRRRSPPSRMNKKDMSSLSFICSKNKSKQFEKGPGSMSQTDLVTEWDREQRQIMQVVENVERVIIGKRKTIQLSLVALLCGGHVLLEDVPGVGKTMLVKAIAKSLDLDFRRIQFTPDLLPSDVTGVSVYNQKTMEFE